MAYARKLIVVVPAVALAAAAVRGENAIPVVPDWDRCVSYSEETGKRQIDPVCFFEMLIARYRCLEAYEDIAKVIQVTERLGEEPLRVETLIGCEIEGDRLLIETPASQVRRTVGLNVRYRKSPAIEAAELSYNLWLAPHMALRFAEEPQREFRPGVRDGFTPTEAESVTIDERPMVHLQLKSGDGRAEACESQFDLYVNPDSMLVERITGQERLPGGASYETSLEITPISAHNAEGGLGGGGEPPAATAEPVEPPARPGGLADVGPHLSPKQAGPATAPPTGAEPPADRPPHETGQTKGPASPPQQDPPRDRGPELAPPGRTDLKPPAKADQDQSPPDEARSEDHKSAADDDDDRGSSAPPKPGQSPPTGTPPPAGRSMTCVGR
jgi:hypothetical protein